MPGAERTVRWIDASEFAGLADAWNALLRASAADCVFLTWEWLQSWWEVFGRTSELLLPAVFEGGRLVAAAPLKIETRRRYGLSFRQVEVIGTGRVVSPDLLDLVVERGREAELAPVLADAVLGARSRWDKLRLTDLHGEAAAAPRFAARIADAGFACRVEPGRTCPYLPRPARWEDVLAARSHNFRRNHRKKRRRLAEVGVDRFEVWGPGEDVTAAMEAVAALHTGRMQQAGRGGHFHKADYRAFHFGVAQRFAERGWLFVAFLGQEGRRVAARYGYLYGGTYYAYQSGFDPGFADHSPGEVMLGYVIEHLVGRGVRELNFLRGTQPHKYFWTDRERRSEHLEGWNRSARGRVLFVLDRLAAHRRRVRVLTDRWGRGTAGDGDTPRAVATAPEGAHEHRPAAD
jgi:CelD/BcsL family acetyltransferase involved in cellulose biosynthesis